MSSLSKVYLKYETLEMILSTLKKKGESGINLMIDISDEAKTFTRDNGDRVNTNVGVYVEQTQEQKEAKAKRFYVANGNCVWTDGNITAVKGYEKAGDVSVGDYSSQLSGEVDDLPF